MREATPLCDRLGIPYPLFQAPMAGVATPELAAAVGQAGGLGGLGLGATAPEHWAALLARYQALCSAPLHLNFFCHAPPSTDPNRDQAWLSACAPLFEALGAAVPPTLSPPYEPFSALEDLEAPLKSLRPGVVSFHFGLPRPDQMDTLRRLGQRLLVSVTNLDDARVAEAAGVDGLIVQGREAGGHHSVFSGQAEGSVHSTEAFLRALRPRTGLPLVAAGGVMTGQALRKLLDAGADAVQLGTAFLLCPEASTPPAQRARLQRAKGEKTVLYRGFSGSPARGLANRLFHHLAGACPAEVPPYPLPYDLSKRLAAAAPAGALEDLSVCWAGEGFEALRELPAATLVRALLEEARLSQGKRIGVHDA